MCVPLKTVEPQRRIDSFEIVVGVSPTLDSYAEIIYFLSTTTHSQRYARSEYIASGQPLGIIIIIF